MYGGTKRVVKSLTAILFGLGIIVMIALIWFQRHSRANRAEELVKNVLKWEINEVGPAIVELERFKDLVVPKLKAIVGDADHDVAVVQRANLGLIPFGESNPNTMTEMVLSSDCSPETVLTVAHLVKDRIITEKIKPKLLDLVMTKNAPAAIRFRAALFLAQIDSDVADWTKYSGFLISALLEEPFESHRMWIIAMRPIGILQISRLKQLFSDSEDRLNSITLASAIFSFLPPETRNQQLVELLLASNGPQFNGILTVYENNEALQQMENELKRRSKEHLTSSQRSSLSIALMRIGDSSIFAEQICNLDEIALRTGTITSATSTRISFDCLVKHYSQHQTSMESAARQAILMIFSERVLSLEDENQLNWLTQKATQLCLTEKDAGCFTAGEVLLRRLSRRVEGIDVENIRRRRRDNFSNPGLRGLRGDVFIDGQNLVYKVFLPNDKNGLARPVAISLYELSEREFRRIMHQEDSKSTRPKTFSTMSEIVPLLNTLNELESISVKQQAFSSNGDESEEVLTINTNKSGYRPMTSKELHLVVDGDQKLIGPEFEFAKWFARTEDFTDGTMISIGELLPTPKGMCDIFGNAYELMIGTKGDKVVAYAALGSAWVDRRQIMAKPLKEPSSYVGIFLGLRLARTIAVN